MRKKYLSFFLFSLFLFNLSAIFIKPAKAETMDWFSIGSLYDTIYDNEYVVSIYLPDLSNFLNNPPSSQIWSFISAEIDVHVDITTLDGAFTIIASTIAFIDTDTTLPVTYSLWSSGYIGAGGIGSWSAYFYYKTGAESTINYEIDLDYDFSHTRNYQISITYYAKINYSVSSVWINVLMTNMMRFIKIILVFFLAFVLKSLFGKMGFPIGLLGGSILFYISGLISNFENLFLIFISMIIFYILIKDKKSEKSDEL